MKKENNEGENRMLLDKYNKCFLELRDIINSWDPYDLIGMGAPKDEFNLEVRSILANLKIDSNQDEVVKIISNTFIKAFSDDKFDNEACRKVGYEVYKWWSKIVSQMITS